MADHHEFLRYDDRSRYRLLDRMRCDCEYYLGYGNRAPKHLWAGSEREQIECMKALWNSFPEGEKPLFLSFEQILDYEKRMVSEKVPLQAQIDAASSQTAGHDPGRKEMLQER